MALAGRALCCADRRATLTPQRRSHTIGARSHPPKIQLRLADYDQLTAPHVGIRNGGGCSIEHMFEPLHSKCDWHVLPYSNYMPTGPDENIVCDSVAFNCSQQLWPPVISVCRRATAMHGTRVPKATVNEDSDFALGEHKVRSHGSIGYEQPEVLAKSVTFPVKVGANCNLGRGVGTFDRSHVARSARRRRRLANNINDIFWRHVDLKFQSRGTGEKMLVVKCFTRPANLEKQA